MHIYNYYCNIFAMLHNHYTTNFVFRLSKIMGLKYIQQQQISRKENFIPSATVFQDVGRVNSSPSKSASSKEDSDSDCTCDIDK